MKNIVLVIFGVTALLFNSCTQIQKNNTINQDPLPSWNDGNTKKSIIDFVTKSTTEGSADFIPESDRIACFDNDGTLWSEQPIYFQFLFAIERIKKLSDVHPEWHDQQLFKAAIEDDIETVMKSGMEGLLTLTMASHAGMSTDEFNVIVSEWINTARHHKTGLFYKEMVFQPMLEVLEYLQANGFKTYIVSGGGIDFMRTFAEEVYGIPPEQIIGSSMKYRFEMKNGIPEINKVPEIEFLNDKDGKPIGIHKSIGKKPVAAFGNSDGDLAMLQWTSVSAENNLMVYIHHTDADREWAYDRNSSIGRLDKGLDEAKSKGWTIADMKKDWKVIYPFEMEHN